MRLTVLLRSSAAPATLAHARFHPPAVVPSLCHFSTACPVLPPFSRLVCRSRISFRRLPAVDKGSPAVDMAEYVAVNTSNVERVDSLRQQLKNLFKESLVATVPTLPDVDPLVSPCNNASHGDYQCNNAMGVYTKIKGNSTEFRNPRAIGEAVARNLPESLLVARTSIAGPGFVNIVLSTNWIEQRLFQLLTDGIESWAPALPFKRVLVDFSSPNIAKEMHVGHLRSTIIGESVTRILEYCGADVLRRNHVGDWGTQFGMLIAYLFEEFPNWEEIGEQAIGDLQAFYRASKRKFDEDPAFKAKSQQSVVLLQGGEEMHRAAWKKICNISRREFDQVYKRLNVIIEERGESFYNGYISDVVQQLEGKGLIEESEGAKVIRVKGHDIPLIIVKRDGGFNYATTDITAFWYRKNVEKAELMVYVTDIGQQMHFDMVFNALTQAGWIPVDDTEFPKVKHVGFGLVLGSDGKKFKTRSSEVVRLVDLLDEAKNRSKDELMKRGKDSEWTAEELNEAAEALGYGAVKYADLKNNRTTNYTFNFEQMLDIRGNTAVYLLYAHARICSIIRNSKRDIDELKKSNSLQLIHPSERQLGLHLVQFPEVVEDTLKDFLPNTLCEYLYSLAGHFTDFYTNCKVVGSPEETSRLLLCEATAVIMRQCFRLLGITPLYRL